MWMKRVAALAAAVTIAAGAAACDRASGLSQGGAESSGGKGRQAARSAAGGESEGAKLYMAACVMCHGEDGRGTQLGPSLVDAEWVHGDSLSMAGIAQVVRDGVPQPGEQHPVPMPPRGNGRFTDAEIQAVAEYTHSLAR